MSKSFCLSVKFYPFFCMTYLSKLRYTHNGEIISPFSILESWPLKLNMRTRC
jgi:hypothetical protein